MSRLSGKCDLYDSLSFCVMRNKDGKIMEKGFAEPDSGNVLYSDIYECFEKFKEETGGVLHRHVKIDRISEYNQDNVAKMCPELEIIPHTAVVEDKRCKSGQKEITSYTYKYWGKEYKSLKELNKKGIYIDDPIYFDSILELLPYLPYLVGAMAFDGESGKKIVWIGNESFAESEHRDMLRSGYSSNSIHYYRKQLAQLYFDVCKDYLCYKLDERTVISKIENLERNAEGNYLLKLSNDIDSNHPIYYIWDDNTIHSHWTSPKIVGKDVLELSKADVENFLKDDIHNSTIKIKYVKLPDGGFPIHLG